MKATFHNLCRVTAFLVVALGGIAVAGTVRVEGFSDSDGDTLVGVAEDLDGDAVYGTVSAAVASAGTTGRVLIVTTGEFRENVVVSNVQRLTIEAVPGVRAVIQAAAGAGDDVGALSVFADSVRSFIHLKNVVFAESPIGLKLNSRGDLEVHVENCSIEANKNYGVHCSGAIRLTMRTSTVANTGHWTSAGVPPASPLGAGIVLAAFSQNYIFGCNIIGNRFGFIHPDKANGKAQLKQVDNVVRNGNSPGFVYGID